jgi:hypothetical protein
LWEVGGGAESWEVGREVEVGGTSSRGLGVTEPLEREPSENSEEEREVFMAKLLMAE